MSEWDAQAAHRSEAIRAHHRGIPGNVRTEVVANDGRSRYFSRIENCHEVTDRLVWCIGFGFHGSRTLSVATHIERDGLKSRACYRLHLRFPTRPDGWEPMAKENGRAFAHLREMKGYSVRLYLMVLHRYRSWIAKHTLVRDS